MQCAVVTCAQFNLCGGLAMVKSGVDSLDSPADTSLSMLSRVFSTTLSTMLPNSGRLQEIAKPQ